MRGKREGGTDGIGSSFSSLHVALVAYFVSPGRGSEPRNGWAWMTQLAQRVGRVSLVTSPETTGHVPAGQVNTVPTNVDVIEVPNVRRAMGHPIPDWYRMYAAWLDGAASAVADCDPDLAHHVGVGTPFWGSSLRDVTRPAVLGPVGISPPPPVAFLPQWGLRGTAQETVRALFGAWPRLWPRGRAGVQHAQLVLAADPATAGLAASYGIAWAPELIEGVDRVTGVCDQRPSPVMVWAGSMVSRKGPLLAVDAWIRAQEHLPAGSTLLMFGDGPLLAEVRAAASGARRWTPIHVPGAVDHRTVMQSLGTAKALLFTSLRDTSSSQMLDAMSAGTPCVSLRHGGVRGLDLWYPEESGWVVRASSWGTAAEALSRAIVQALTADEPTWAHRSEVGRAIAQRHTWTAKAERALALYATLLA